MLLTIITILHQHHNTTSSTGLVHTRHAWRADSFLTHHRDPAFDCSHTISRSCSDLLHGQFPSSSNIHRDPNSDRHQFTSEALAAIRASVFLSVPSLLSACLASRVDRPSSPPFNHTPSTTTTAATPAPSTFSVYHTKLHGSRQATPLHHTTTSPHHSTHKTAFNGPGAASACFCACCMRDTHIFLDRRSSTSSFQ